MMEGNGLNGGMRGYLLQGAGFKGQGSRGGVQGAGSGFGRV